MDKKEYFALIRSWEEIYGKPEFGVGRYNPADVKACCEKCGQTRKHMARHHKANDFFFALWFPNLYARRYMEFRREDCAKLCEGCHSSCERYYAPLKHQMYDSFSYYKDKGYDLEWWTSWCEKWRTKFLLQYEKWLAFKKRKKRKKV